MVFGFRSQSPHTHRVSILSYCRTTAEKSCSPAGLSTLVVYAYVVDCAPGPPYACYSTQWFPDDPDAPSIEATPLTATSADLGSGWVWVWDWVHLHTQSPRTRSPEEMCVCSHRSASQDTLRNCTKCRGILAHTRIKPSLSWRQMRLLVESCCAQLTI